MDLRTPNLHAWVMDGLAPWAQALSGGKPSCAWLVLPWSHVPNTILFGQPWYHQDTGDEGQPADQVGASAHARLHIAQFAPAAITGWRALITTLTPMLNPNITNGIITFRWRDGQPRVVLEVRAFSKTYSTVTVAQNGQVAHCVPDLLREIEDPGFLACAPSHMPAHATAQQAR